MSQSSLKTKFSPRLCATLAVVDEAGTSDPDHNPGLSQDRVAAHLPMQTLRNLRELTIKGGHLHGCLPEWWGQLSNLTHLELPRCGDLVRLHFMRGLRSLTLATHLGEDNLDAKTLPWVVEDRDSPLDSLTVNVVGGAQAKVKRLEASARAVRQKVPGLLVKVIVDG